MTDGIIQKVLRPYKLEATEILDEKQLKYLDDLENELIKEIDNAFNLKYKTWENLLHTIIGDSKE